MCGSAPKDRSAEIAAQKERERQARIKEGTTKVNEIFGQFGDDYYGGIANTYQEHYQPLVDEQYDTAKRDLILSTPGGTGSSAFAKKLGDLEKAYQRELVSLGERASGESNRYRSDVASNRSQLLSQLEAGSGVDTVASLAAERALALTAPPAFSSLGDLFAKFSADAANYTQAANAGYQAQPLLFGGNSSGGGNSKALRVVG